MSIERPRQPTEEQLADLAPLYDPVRRRLYLYVAAQPQDVSRDEAAAAAGVARGLAAFHLDKLVETGFLEASFRRLTGRAGPGAGRPSKLYRPSAKEHHLSLPPRDYELVAQLLAESVLEDDGMPARTSLAEVARRFGRGLGDQVRQGLGRRASRHRRREALNEALEARGYQPYRDGTEVRLGNCPFQGLAERHRELVCGMNLSLLQGVVDGLEAIGLQARPQPAPPGCCVAIGPGGRGEGLPSPAS